MTVQLKPKPFDPFRLLLQYQESRLAPGSYGATASFIGTMRDFNQGDSVKRLFLEHYPGMTERELEKIIAEARQRWAFLEALVAHRVGDIFPGEPIVLVVVWSVHRGPAFDACRYIMEALKSRAPFWKKEKLPHKERWVSNDENLQN